MTETACASSGFLPPSGYRRSVAVTVSIRDQAGARATAEPALELDVPAAVTLRDLIRTRAREEVAKANAAIGAGQAFRTLVQPTEAEEARWADTLGCDDQRWTQVSPWKTEAGEGLLAEPPVVAVSTVIAAAARDQPDAWTLALALARRKLAFTADDVGLLFALARDPPKRPRPSYQTSPAGGVWFMNREELARVHRDHLTRIGLAAAERLPAEQWTDDLRGAIEEAQALAERDKSLGYEVERTRLLSRFRKLLGDSDVGAAAAPLDVEVVAADDKMGKPLRKELAERWGSDPGAGPLLIHLTQATTGPAPAKTWQGRARELVAATGDGDELLRTILTRALAAEDGTRRAWGGLAYQWLSDENAVLVRGAIWAAGAVGAHWAPELLAELAEYAATPFERGYDPRSIKVANAAARQLGELGSNDAVAALARLKAQIIHKTIGKQVERALEQAAAAAG